MEKNDLIKKLEKTSLPEVEIPGHKRELRRVLLEKFHREKRSWEIFNILKKAIPVGAVAIILIFLIFNTLTSPQYTLAQAEKIALKNPQIKELVEKGAIIKDVKILKEKGYVLIQLPEEAPMEIPARVSPEKEEAGLEKKPKFIGIFTEVDFKHKKVSRIENIAPQSFSLAEKEREKAKQIAESSPEIRKIVPSSAKVKEITPIPSSRLKLIKQENSIQVVPEKEKRVKIIYELNKQKWEGEIDLIKEEIKEVRFLGEIEKE